MDLVDSLLPRPHLNQLKKRQKCDSSICIHLLFVTPFFITSPTIPRCNSKWLVGFIF